MSRSTWTVNAYSAKWLKRGFPWVYPKEIVSGRPVEGREVRLVSPSGEVLGRGLADRGWIAARVFRRDAGPLDRAWADAVVSRALALRAQVVAEDTTAYRLVNAESDFLPGVRVDRWGHFLVMTLDTPSVAPILPVLIESLNDAVGPRGIYLCYRPDPRDARDFDALTPHPGLIAGHPASGAVRVLEHGLAFDVYPAEGPDVGLYTDMRDLRAWMAPHWGGTRVLNTFAFTGAFSVTAAHGGASSVTSVDLSRKVLDRAEDNFRANQLDPSEHDFFAMDVFKALDRFRRKGERFDRVILDPPAFSRGTAVWSAKRDYPRLVAAACRVMTPDGWLIVASNQGELTPHRFTGFIQDGFRRAGRDAQRLWTGSQAGDVPAASWFPEASYLKLSVYRVL